MGIICALDGEVSGVYIGSKVIVRGKINVYDRATNPGEFDSRRYYISKGYLFKAYSCELISSDHKRKFVADISYRLSERVGSLLDHSLNEKDAGMMKAVLLADKSDLDKDTKDLYKDAGAGHLLAISGLHITMFAALILYILKKTPINLKADYVITILFLYGYGFVIGFSASALRIATFLSVSFLIFCASASPSAW